MVIQFDVWGNISEVSKDGHELLGDNGRFWVKQTFIESDNVKYEDSDGNYWVKGICEVNPFTLYVYNNSDALDEFHYPYSGSLMNHENMINIGSYSIKESYWEVADEFILAPIVQFNDLVLNPYGNGIYTTVYVNAESSWGRATATTIGATTPIGFNIENVTIEQVEKPSMLKKFMNLTKNCYENLKISKWGRKSVNPNEFTGNSITISTDVVDNDGWDPANAWELDSYYQLTDNDEWEIIGNVNENC